MAGRGRGRGSRGRGFTFDVSVLGIGRGKDAMPAPILQPPPLYPTLERKPLPLNNSEEDGYMLSLKREFRGCMRDSPYFIKPEVIKKDVERYSDRYKEKAHSGDTVIEWQPNWNLFPAELKIKVRKRGSSHGKGPKLVERPAKKIKESSGTANEVSIKLDSLFQDVAEKEKQENEKKGGDDENEDDDEVDDEEDYDEEEQEEENDYLVSHFDDDEDYGFLDEDDMDEGPIY